MKMTGKKYGYDSRLAFVKENIDTISIVDMAKELGITVGALDYNIAEWRKRGLLPPKVRTYNGRVKTVNTDFFSFKDEYELFLGEYL